MTLFAPVMPEPRGFVPGKPEAGYVSEATPPRFDTDIDKIFKAVCAKGFTFEQWQIAAFITAVRTKPFVIMAGISGTGKTKLPRIISEVTSATFDLFPVRPDWTDSSDLLGYRDITGKFIPGLLLVAAKEAQAAPDKQRFVMLDEMNIARVEYYMAEVLSHIEERFRSSGGTVASKPLTPDGDTGWTEVCLPSNLCIVGTVNMDESTDGFSRKVLDRCFILEFSDIDLEEIATVAATQPEIVRWNATHWRQRCISLAEFPDRDNPILKRAIEVLQVVNKHLVPVQLQVAYRVRDEVVLFCINAQDCIDSFVTTDGKNVDPLDLAITMKILPRIQGGSPGIRKTLEALLEWAERRSPKTGVALTAVGQPPEGQTATGEGEPEDARAENHELGETKPVEEKPVDAFPLCAARLRLMIDRYDENGFTAFWL